MEETNGNTIKFPLVPETPEGFLLIPSPRNFNPTLIHPSESVWVGYQEENKWNPSWCQERVWYLSLKKTMHELRQSFEGTQDIICQMMMDTPRQLLYINQTRISQEDELHQVLKKWDKQYPTSLKEEMMMVSTQAILSIPLISLVHSFPKEYIGELSQTKEECYPQRIEWCIMENSPTDAALPSPPPICQVTKRLRSFVVCPHTSQDETQQFIDIQIDLDWSGDNMIVGTRLHQDE